MDLFNLDVVIKYGPALLRGLSVTVFLTLVVIAAALVLAIPVALVRMSPNVLLRGIGSLYVEVIRGTPLLLQLVYIYYVLPSFGINLDPLLAAIVGLTLNYTAYMSEVYRGGILAVPKSQWEAAATVGMTKARAFHRIVLPQALRIVTPALGNYFISLFKDTALCLGRHRAGAHLHRADHLGPFLPVLHDLYGDRHSLSRRRLSCRLVRALARETDVARLSSEEGCMIELVDIHKSFGTWKC